MADVNALLEYCCANGRICPQPQRWNELYQMLPNARRVGVGFEPSAPLILAAWWEATDEQKRDRVLSHIRWANQQGALAKVDGFLRSLPESDWYHGD
jgi:hypothetical protein